MLQDAISILPQFEVFSCLDCKKSPEERPNPGYGLPITGILRHQRHKAYANSLCGSADDAYKPLKRHMHTNVSTMMIVITAFLSEHMSLWTIWRLMCIHSSSKHAMSCLALLHVSRGLMCTHSGVRSDAFCPKTSSEPSPSLQPFQTLYRTKIHQLSCSTTTLVP